MKSRLMPIALWLLAMAVCAAIIRHTPITTDMSAFLPKGASQTERVMVSQIRDGALSRTIIAGIENAPVATLVALDRRLGEALAGDPAFATVIDGDLSLHRADAALLWRNRYLLNPDVVPGRFSEAGLRQALTADLAQLGSTAGMALKQTLAADPTQEMTGLIDMMTGELHASMQDGILVSPDGNRAMLVLETAAAGADLDGQQQAQAALERAFEGARANDPAAAAARLVYGGPGVFAVHARDSMKRSTTRVSALATLLVAALLLAAYRSPLQLGLSLLPVASGVVAGMAAVSARYGFVHGITLGFGVTLIGEAVDYAVYYFSAASDRAALQRLWPVLALGMGCSVVGFAAMLGSGFQGFAQLGLFTIAGLVTALAVTRFVLPALLPHAKPVHVVQLLSVEFRHIPRSTIGYAVAIILIGAVLAISLHKGSLWQQSLDSLSPVPPAEMALYKSLRQDIGESDQTLSVLVTVPTLQGVLQASEALEPDLRKLRSQGALAGFVSPASLLPSDAAQHDRQAAIPNPDTLKASLEHATTGLPFKPGLFAPFLADAEAARHAAPITPETYVGTDLALKLQSQLFQTGTEWNAVIMLDGVADPAAVQQAIAHSAERAAIVLLDTKSQSAQLLATYRTEALTLAAAGSCAIALLLLIVLRSARRTARVLLPLVASVTVTLAVMLLVAGSLSIFHLFGLLLTVAVGSNYCLFLERSAGGEERGRTLSALVLANLCTVIGFGVLSLSSVPVLQGIGGTVAVGALLSLVFGLAMIRPASSARIPA